MVNLKTVFFTLIWSAAISALLYHLLLRQVFSSARLKDLVDDEGLYSDSVKEAELHNTGRNNPDSLHHDFKGATTFMTEQTTMNSTNPSKSTDNDRGPAPRMSVTKPDSQERNQSDSVQYLLPAETRQAMNNRFLFPVVHFDGGPNFQYRQLKTAIQFAVYLNRTLVLPEFRHHRTSYHMGRVFFEETFNVSVFQEFMPAISIQTFREKCGSHIIDIIQFRRSFEKDGPDPLPESYDKQTGYIHQRLNIEFPDAKTITFPKNDAEAWSKIEKAKDAKCVVMISPVGFEKVKLPNMDTISRGISGHLVRTSIVGGAVDSILPRLCDGKPVLSFHWRNKTGEGCRIGHLKTEADSRCDSLLQTQCGIIRNISSHMNILSKQLKIGCVFIATAPEEPREHVIREVSAVTKNVAKVLTIDDVIELHNPKVDEFRDDDYFISLFEQELCAKSAAFFGFTKSNWSKFLVQEREAFNRKHTYDVVRDFPDLKFARDFV
ncbi:uncharacterized protein [Ptychodera flava]|uniref:uncharacterized protein n=1 Tax=Ptychodera flava TaxID=63121 RepID=UPI00396A9395